MTDLYAKLTLAAIAGFVIVSAGVVTPIEAKGDMAPELGAPRLERVHADDHAIYDQDGATLLTIDAFPSQLAVDDDAAFAAASAIRGASLSPDASLIAVQTSSASHGASWLYDPRDETLRPASFQYGGASEIAGWRDDSHYLAAIERGPGPADQIRLIERSETHDEVSDYGLTIGTEPSQVSVQGEPEGELELYPIGWYGAHFCFEANGAQHCVDPNDEALTGYPPDADM